MRPPFVFVPYKHIIANGFVLVKHTIDKNVRVSYTSYERGMLMVNNIKAARKAAKMTQGELALKLGINRATISKYESGEISLSLEMLIKIAAVLGVDWSDLVPEEDRAQVVSNGMKKKLAEATKNGGMRKLSVSEVLQMATLQFNSEEDRTAFFYSRLNTDGMLAAGKFFFRHLKPEDMKEVADYVEELANTPQYQRPQDK